jgi:nitroreductase/NAD-dependent dihydropyrimidine dehydrogenase PreA subunit
MEFTIDPGICTACGICINECPSRAIRKEQTYARITAGRCIECSHCGMVCPTGAVRVDGTSLPPYPDDLNELTAAERLEHLILSKRSVRSYKSAPVVQEDLRAVIRAGETTATATNSQHSKAHVFEGGEVAALTSLAARSLLPFLKLGLHPAGRLILRAAGLKRYAKKEMVTGFHKLILKTLDGRADPLFFRAPAVVVLTYPAKAGKRFGRTDCALAGENMMLTAHARNLESCMIGFAEAALHSKRIRAKIGIPRDRKIGLIFTLGYTDTKYYRYPVRKSWRL